MQVDVKKLLAEIKSETVKDNNSLFGWSKVKNPIEYADYQKFVNTAGSKGRAKKWLHAIVKEINNS